MLSYPENTRRNQFRMLVALIFLSLVQDVFWFVLNRDVDDDEDDGGLERSVKSFSRLMSFVSFVWRVSLERLLVLRICFFSRTLLTYVPFLCFSVVCAGYDPVEGLLRLRGDCEREESE